MGKKFFKNKNMAVELPIELELRKLGLSEKEVKVYLVGLELGPSPVKDIAKRVKIPRPTVYEIIKKLEEKKLFIEIKKGKRRLFVAQSPIQILRILKIQKREIEEKEREFTRIVAALEAKYGKEKELRIFKGKRGFKTFLEIFSLSVNPEILIINPNLIPVSKKEIEKVFQKMKKRLGKLEIKKIEMKIKGSLIVFDKVAYFPEGSDKCFLFEF